jgi:ABC-type transport system involved in multi-copper enzyme maturation permease subunit
MALESERDMNQFIRLMRKDWRLSRATVVGLLIMNVVSYCLGLTVYLWDKYTTVVSTPYRAGHAVTYNVQVGGRLSGYMDSAAEMGLLFMMLAAGVMGGAAFAFERRERSADFLAMLPVKRSRIIASKLLVSFVVLGSVLAIETGVLLCSHFQRQWETVPELLLATSSFAAAALAAFAMGWLLSTFLSSTAIAASVAILLTCFVSFWFDVMSQHTMTWVMPPEIALSVAVILILVANMYYLRRVSP